MPAWPEDFRWGTAASALQCEGAAPASDWATWESEGWAPPSGDGNGFRTRYRDDLQLLADHGFTDHRLVVEWARLEPDDGQRDGDEVEHVRDVLAAGRAAGLRMWVCLQHATLPRWFTDDLRGFRDDKVGRYRWSAHVDQCAEAFGDLVDGWQPMESPSRYALEGFLFGRLPPGRTDVREFPGVLATVHQAAADAARLLAGSGVPVASSHWLAPLRPATPAAEEFLWEAWAVPELVEPFDLLGVTANAPVRADPDPTDDEDEDRFVLTGEPEPSREQVADGVAEVIGRLTELFPDMPLLVRGTELAVEDETRRADHVESLLGAVSAAIEAGADVQGYFHWAAVDGYELDGGFATKRGLFDRDRNARGSLESLATARDM